MKGNAGISIASRKDHLMEVGALPLKRKHFLV